MLSTSAATGRGRSGAARDAPAVTRGGIGRRGVTRGTWEGILGPMGDGKADDDPARPREGWREHPADEPHSWGPVSERHWSRARKDANREALEHMRERSRAPGVAAGGGARNVYCLECHGVIPFDGGAKPATCPHCGAALDARVQAMFNWVEIDEAPRGDLGALVRVALAGLAVLIAVAALLLWILR